MPTDAATIWLALKSRLDTLPVDWPLFEPDATVERPSDAVGPLPFILVSDSRNEPERIGIAAGPLGVIHARSGTLMLGLHYPVSRPIAYTQLVEMGGQIAAHFPADTRMNFGAVCLRVTQDADVAQPYRDGVNRVVMVRARWSTV